MIKGGGNTGCGYKGKCKGKLKPPVELGESPVGVIRVRGAGYEWMDSRKQTSCEIVGVAHTKGEPLVITMNKGNIQLLPQIWVTGASHQSGKGGVGRVAQVCIRPEPVPVGLEQ